MIHRVMRGLEQRDTSSLAEPKDWLWDALGGTPSYTGKSVSVETSLRLVAVYAAVRIIAMGGGTLPMVVTRGKGRDRKLADDSPQWELLHEEPNADQTADHFFETVLGHLNTWGNFYAEKVGAQANGRRIVSELRPLSPAKVTVGRDANGNKTFKVEGYDTAFTDQTILHVPGFGYDGLTGLSPVMQARQQLGLNMAREEFQARFYANNAHPGGVIEHPGTLGDAAAKRLKAEWEALHRGLANSNRIAVLEEGASWQSIGLPLRDMQFIESQQFDATQIAVLYQVPPSWVGGSTGEPLTYSTVEGEALHFVKYSLRPWLVRIERALRKDRDLFPDRDLRPKFQADELLRGDSQARSAFYKTMKEIGVMSPNDIRDAEDMPPREGGDIYQDVMAGTAPAATPANGGTGG